MTKTILILAVALMAWPGDLAAQATDSRFAAWLGCWRLEDDLAGTGARMCIIPDEGGVRLQTVVGSTKGLDERLIPDGVARPVVDAACKGSEHARWSADGLRVFRSITVTCDGETPRTISSVAFLGAGPAWTNVQHVSGGQGAAVRVQRYRRAVNQNLADGSKAPQATTPVVLSATELNWGIEDVIEASDRLPAEALQAALSEARHGFNLNKNALLALDAADVPEDVIDLMVALTFPSRFVVERAGGSSAPVGVSTGMGWYDPFMSPLLSPYGSYYGNCYGQHGYVGYRSYYSTCGGYYGYSPYGYSTYGYYPYQNNPGWIGVGPGDPGTPQPSGRGRVINGQGYTRIRERSPEPAGPRMTGTGDGSAAGWSGARRGGASSGGYSSGSGGSNSGSGSSGSTGSSGGTSTGSGSGGRTAVPRPPGGGN
jgi:hypothetical protein